MDYLFITKSGSPYYTATKDRETIKSRTLPKGEAVRLFISRQLLPCLRQYHPKIKLSFHDLRATFGMNLLEDKLDQVKPTIGNYDLVLRYVQDRMGHARLETTERYLKYRDKLKIFTHTQSEFESYVQSLCADPA
jgi:integrase